MRRTLLPVIALQQVLLRGLVRVKHGEGIDGKHVHCTYNRPRLDILYLSASSDDQVLLRFIEFH